MSEKKKSTSLVESDGRQSNGRFVSGHRKIGGIKKGDKHKFTSLKDSFVKAFELTGGTQGLIDFIEKNPRNRAQFYQMITKMLPSSIDMDVKGRIEAVIVSDKFLPKDDGS